MANTKPALQAQIVIDATNKYIDVDDGGGEDTLTLTEGTYDDIHALCTQIQSEMDEAFAADWSVTVSDEGIVTIANTDPASFSIDWKTGSHGSDNLDTHMGTVLGFSDAADDASAASHAADYQHMYGWYPHRYPVRMGPWQPMAVGGEQRHTLSGTNSKKLHAAFHHTYGVEFALLEPEYVYSAEATGSDANKDLEHVWEDLAQGDFGTWYTDASDTGSGTKCYLLSPHDWGGVVTRPHIDYKAYDLSLKFREQES